MAPPHLTAENLVIVFHSYPPKPCVDGLMSIIIATEYTKSKNVKLVPYWRTDTSFERVKKTVESVGLNNTSIIYVDCAPDLEEEVKYLLDIQSDLVSIEVYDHHVKKTSPMYKLKDNKRKFYYKIENKKCGAKLVYEHILTETQKEDFKKYKNLLTMVHFSDYEGMDPKSSGKPETQKIAMAAFNKAIEANAGSTCEKNLEKIKEQNMCIYYILDNIMAEKVDWAFFYDNTLSDDDIYKKFLDQKEIYLRDSLSVMSGDSKTVYNEEKTMEYNNLCEDMEKKLTKGCVIEGKQIKSKKVDIFVCHIDILECGRTLEPYVQTEMERRKAAFAILMNNATQNNQGKEMYYFSLRRHKDGDAKNLATYIMKVSGSEIGGGHPWASGVSLNQEQYRQFIEAESLNELL